MGRPGVVDGARVATDGVEGVRGAAAGLAIEDRFAALPCGSVAAERFGALRREARSACLRALSAMAVSLAESKGWHVMAT